MRHLSIEERLGATRDRALTRWLAGQASRVAKSVPIQPANERTSKVRVFIMMAIAMALAVVTGHYVVKP